MKKRRPFWTSLPLAEGAESTGHRAQTGHQPHHREKISGNSRVALGSTAERNRKSQLDPFADNIEAWLNEDPFYSAAWIYDRLRPMGFCGSYEIVKRRVGKLKNQSQVGSDGV